METKRGLRFQRLMPRVVVFFNGGIYDQPQMRVCGGGPPKPSLVAVGLVRKFFCVPGAERRALLKQVKGVSVHFNHVLREVSDRSVIDGAPLAQVSRHEVLIELPHHPCGFLSTEPKQCEGF